MMIRIEFRNIQAKFLQKCWSVLCEVKKRQADSTALVATIVLVAGIFPSVVSAQVVNIVFTTGSQVVKLGEVSEQITLQAQGAEGSAVNIPLTGCLFLRSTGSQGQFSSNSTNWNSVSVLTMNKNTANKNFYYKDAQEGTQTITVKMALKPENESRSCASFPIGEWNIQWIVTQSISIGASPSSSSFGSSGAGDATTTGETAILGRGSGDIVVPPSPKLFADGGSDRTVIVGADTEFKARAYDQKKNTIDFSSFRWNFGDGSIAEKSTVLHRFDYPGKYLVVLDIPAEKDSVSDHIIVTVESLKLALSLMSDGGVSILNLIGHTLDLSGWVLRSMGRTFIIPQHTLVLANNPLRIPQRILGFSVGADIELAYPDGSFALSIVSAVTPTSTTSTVVPPHPVSQTKYPTARNINTIHSQAIVQPKAIIDEPTETSFSPAGGISSQVAGAGIVPASSRMWWFGAVGIAGFSAGAFVLARRFSKKEWNIIEEEGDAV